MYLAFQRFLLVRLICQLLLRQLVQTELMAALKRSKTLEAQGKYAEAVPLCQRDSRAALDPLPTGGGKRTSICCATLSLRA